MSTILKVPVPDLTRLSKTNKGVFPQRRVEEQIQAESDAPGHGTREMPIFGHAFAQTGPDAKSGRTRMHDLIEYLKTIQGPIAATRKP
jgi:hypothetical protein